MNIKRFVIILTTLIVGFAALLPTNVQGQTNGAATEVAETQLAGEPTVTAGATEPIVEAQLSPTVPAEATVTPGTDPEPVASFTPTAGVIETTTTLEENPTEIVTLAPTNTLEPTVTLEPTLTATQPAEDCQVIPGLPHVRDNRIKATVDIYGCISVTVNWTLSSNKGDYTEGSKTYMNSKVQHTLADFNDWQLEPGDLVTLKVSGDGFPNRERTSIVIGTEYPVQMKIKRWSPPLCGVTVQGRNDPWIAVFFNGTEIEFFFEGARDWTKSYDFTSGIGKVNTPTVAVYVIAYKDKDRTTPRGSVYEVIPNPCVQLPTNTPTPTFTATPTATFTPTQTITPAPTNETEPPADQSPPTQAVDVCVEFDVRMTVESDPEKGRQTIQRFWVSGYLLDLLRRFQELIGQILSSDVLNTDGCWVYFVHQDYNSSQTKIWRVSSMGETLQQLTEEGGYTEVATSYDGRIAFVKDGVVYIADQLARNPVNMKVEADKLEFQPDGSLYASKDGEIFLVKGIGNKVPLEVETGREIAVEPNGRGINVSDRFFVVPVMFGTQAKSEADEKIASDIALNPYKTPSQGDLLVQFGQVVQDGEQITKGYPALWGIFGGLYDSPSYSQVDWWVWKNWRVAYNSSAVQAAYKLNTATVYRGPYRHAEFVR